MRILSTALVLLTSVVVLHLPAAAKDLDFVFIHPGQPGSPTEGEAVLSAFSSYLEKKLGDGFSVRGRSLNDLAAARKELAKRKAAWGIVSLGVFAEEGERHLMTPIASTRPRGSDRDQWRLLAPLPATKEWRRVRGPMRGTVLHTQQAAACFLFGTEASTLPFLLEGAAEPLKAVRAAARGEGAAVVDLNQWNTLQGVPDLKKLAVVQTSPKIPTSPVVWFGTPGADAARLTKVLLGMKDDPAAASLLKLLQTQGFGPPENDLSKWRITEGRCPG